MIFIDVVHFIGEKSMKHSFVFLCVVAALAVVYCGGSSSTAVSGVDGRYAAVATDGEVFQVAEVDPKETEVLLLLVDCGGAPAFHFKGERCGTQKNSTRTTIQGAVANRYPGSTITRILRGREQWGINFYTVYYVSLRLSGTERN